MDYSIFNTTAYYIPFQSNMGIYIKHRLSIIFVFLTCLDLLLGATLINKSIPPLELETKVYPLEVYNSSNRLQFPYKFEYSQKAIISIQPIQPQQSMAHKKCNFISQTVYLEHISSHPAAWYNTYGPSFYSQVYVPSERLLYSLSLELVLTVYKYAENGSLHKQNYIQLQSLNQRYNQLKSHMVLSDDEAYLYIFTPMNYNLIWRVQTNKLLSRIQSQTMDNFTLQKPVIDTISHQQHIYVALDQEGLAIFKIKEGGTLQLINTIKQIDKKQIFPVSLKVCNTTNLLFILDQIENIYIFNITESFQFFDKILFSHPQNKNLKLFQNRIYFSFYERQFVIQEILYTPKTKQALLIRNFYSPQDISDFYVTREHLMILSHQNLFIYPANLYPKLIQKQLNLVQNVKGDKILHLSNYDYLFIGKSTFTFYKYVFEPPQIVCERGEQGFAFSKTCNQNKTLEFLSFTSACQFSRTIRLQIPPKRSQPTVLHYLSLALFLIIVIIVFAWYIYLFYNKNKILNRQRNNNEIKPETEFQIETTDEIKDIDKKKQIQVNNQGQGQGMEDILKT